MGFKNCQYAVFVNVCLHLVPQSYNDFIQKTKAELSKEPDSTPATKPQIKTPTSATEKPRIKPPPLQRSALTFTNHF